MTSMDWNSALDQRVAEDPSALHAYRRAVATHGVPLPPGPQLYAIADVLDVEPARIMDDIRNQVPDEDHVTAYLNELEKRIIAACQSTPL